jgi:ribonuclease HII
MRTRLGIDEAGRGCVLGPMVFGGFLIAEEHEAGLRALGARDSKKVSAKKRVAMRGKLEDAAKAWRVVEIQPAILDAESLGEITKRVIVDLAEELRPDVLVLDAPVPPSQIPRYRIDLLRRLADRGLRGIEIIAENGADDTYACCSAASILAKTTRDASLAAIQEQAGVPFGSGYPSDPKTRAYLKEVWIEHGEWPAWVRTKWDTIRRVVAECEQPRLL